MGEWIGKDEGVEEGVRKVGCGCSKMVGKGMRKEETSG